MDAKTSKRIGRVMPIICYENPEIVESIIDLIKSGKDFSMFPQNIKNVVIEKEKKMNNLSGSPHPQRSGVGKDSDF